MKYDVEIDLRNANTSHALLVELVGRDKRVLDIGCAGGDLARTLRRHGCRVWGVELEGPAAERAEEALEEVVVGDVGDLDVVGHFGKGSFDVVVFGDVLEHLADPVAVLRKVRPLLADAGAVVASIPNVAHGAVRLALFSGRFDYRPLGLLDSTHLRFFTRGSVHATFREAGLVPIDMRRTTAGVFDTEIAVRREDFDQEIVDAVEGDPDSTTYQFVLKAMPEESAAVIDSPPAPYSGLHPPERARIGVWADREPDDLRGALVLRVTYAELARRLPGATIRSFNSIADAIPSIHDGGIPVEHLGQWSAERAQQLATELDCVAVAAGGPGPVDFHPAADADTAQPLFVVAGSTLDHPAAVDGSIASVPDPLLLVPRMLRSEVLARRLEFVRMMGWFPPQGPVVVVEMDGRLAAKAGVVARGLDKAGAAGAAIVLVQTRPDDAEANHAAEVISAATAKAVFRVPNEAMVDDVVAVIANASVLACSTPSAAALGLAYGRPTGYLEIPDDNQSATNGLVGDLGTRIISPAQLVELLDSEPLESGTDVLPGMQAELDAHFDRIAALADAAAAARPHPPDHRPKLPPSEYTDAVLLAHRSLQQRLDGERRAVADHLAELRHRHEELIGALVSEVEARGQGAAAVEATGADQREADLSNQLESTVAELEALRNLRVLRMLRPARALYARLRGTRL